MVSLERLMKSYRNILNDFRIKMTPEIQHRIIEKYPNLISIENYILDVIVEHLEQYE